MKAIDLKDLVSGLLVVIFAAMALGKYDALAHWATHEAFAAPTMRRGTAARNPKRLGPHRLNSSKIVN
jgi:hypothetical protein